MIRCAATVVVLEPDVYRSAGHPMGPGEPPPRALELEIPELS